MILSKTKRELELKGVEGKLLLLLHLNISLKDKFPRVYQTQDDNNTDSNSTTTVTPDGNIAQQDSVVVTLHIGKILYMNKIKREVKIFLFFLLVGLI